jgi:hypothetical protein
MRRLRGHLGLEGDALPCDHFDLIGGSGLGAYVVYFVKKQLAEMLILYVSFVALCIGPLKMSAIAAMEALQVLGLSVFYDSRDAERKTVFDSDDLRSSVQGIIEGTGVSPDAMIGTIDPKGHSKS